MKILGHEKERELIKKYLDKGYPSYSFLFEGKDCIGKKAIALLTAKSFLCETEYNLGCGECQSCKLVDNTIKNIYEGQDLSPHPFIKLVSPENNKEIKINQIREIIEFLKLKSKTGKVVIIENAEKMNREASNSLLKTLEEPPNKSMIILLASNKTKILPTILSRTLKIKFSPLKEEEIVSILKLKGFSLNDIKKVSKLSDGSLCLILKLLENKTLLKYIKDLYNLITMPTISIEGIYSLSLLLEKLETEELNLILEAIDRALNKKMLEGKLTSEFYEKFIKEKNTLIKAINRGVKRRLAIEGFYTNLLTKETI